MASAILELDNITVVIDGNKIIDGVSWTVDPGQHWAVLGPNGGGKSTLMRVASLGLHPTEGRVTVFDQELGRVDIRHLKARIGLASASLADQLRPRLTAEEVVRCGRFAALEPWWHTYTPEDSEWAVELLDQVGLGHHADRSFGTLSSGERQRCLLARALMNNPDVLMLDEPTAGLDMGGREALVEALEAVASGPGLATAFVTHHVEDIPSTTTHLLAIGAGRAVACGPIESVLTADLLGELFGLDVDLSRHGSRWSARATPA